MPKGYWIARVDDVEAYEEYIATHSEPFREFGARVVRAGAPSGPGNRSAVRNVVIEFPSYQDALDCWHAPDFVAARHLCSQPNADVIVVEGYAPPGGV
jgi:uncharacterized protein (DUF1330 family)